MHLLDYLSTPFIFFLALPLLHPCWVILPVCCIPCWSAVLMPPSSWVIPSPAVTIPSTPDLATRQDCIVVALPLAWPQICLVNCSSFLIASQQTRDIEPLLVQCWSTVYDAGPTLNQQWLNVSCLLGWQVIFPVIHTVTQC